MMGHGSIKMIMYSFCFCLKSRCILGELFTKKPIFQANQELAQLELIRYVVVRGKGYYKSVIVVFV